MPVITPLDICVRVCDSGGSVEMISVLIFLYICHAGMSTSDGSCPTNLSTKISLAATADTGNNHVCQDKNHESEQGKKPVENVVPTKDFDKLKQQLENMAQLLSKTQGLYILLFHFCCFL